MCSQSRPYPFERSIGAFLCDHPVLPPIEDVSRPDPRDIKQDAAIRALIGLRKLGKDIGDDLMAAFNADPGIAIRAYQWAHRDALRKQFGRGLRSHAKLVRQSPIKSDNGPTNHEACALLPDLDSQLQFEAIEDDFLGELRWLWNHGIEGLTLEQTRRVLHLMRHVQLMKDQGQKRVPDNVRQQLSRLRRETGLALDIAQL